MRNLFSNLVDVIDGNAGSNNRVLRDTNPLTKLLKNEKSGVIKNPNPVDIIDIFKTQKQIKNIVRGIQDKVTPVPGSVVYCDLMDVVEHSGIYIGDNTIVHLSGTGNIEAVSPQEFVARLNGRNKSEFIEVSCIDGCAVGSEEVANRAIEMIGSTREYNLILDNCHQFTSGCLSGNFENPYNFLWMLRDEAKRVLGADSWRAWER